MKNVPYVKKYDKFGNVSNPIPAGYFHNFLNRRQRREPMQKVRLFGAIPQIIVCKDGTKKRILHKP